MRPFSASAVRPFIFAYIGILVSACTAQAQLSTSFVRKLGMESAWKSQVQVPRTGRGIVSTHLWVDPKVTKKYAVVELPERTIRIDADRLDRNGKPIGIAEAKKMAKTYAARLTGKDTSEVKEVVVPESRLVIVTSDGLVQNLNAETGKVIWTSACGSAAAPAFPAAVSPVGVSVLHGERLYLLDWKTGKHKSSQRLRYPASASIGVCNDLAFVTDIKGRVQSYRLTSGKQARYGYIISGRAVGNPVNNNQFSAIASDAGYVYVFAGGDKPTEWIRYESSSPITGGLAFGNNAFYASTTGVVSKITLSDRLGRINWEYHTGQPTSSPPLVIGDMVYVSTDSGELTAIEDSTGFEKWNASGMSIDQAIGKAGNDLFALSRHGELIVLDSDSGAVKGRSGVINIAKPCTNQINDRIYLVAKTGQIQCIRHVGAELPTMIEPVKVQAAADGQTPAAGGENIFEAGGNANPFAADAGANPFGGAAAADGGDPFGGGDGSDPFGGDGMGGDDPFGGDGGDPFGGDGGMEDPFGGDGSDPFGGSF